MTNDFYLAISLIGLFIICFAMTSHFIKEKLYLSESLLATAFGILIGPVGFGLFDWTNTKNPINREAFYELTRFVLAFQIMVSGMNLPSAYLRNKARSLAILLGPIIIASWIISSLLIYLLYGSTISIVNAFL